MKDIKSIIEIDLNLPIGDVPNILESSDAKINQWLGEQKISEESREDLRAIIDEIRKATASTKD